MKIFFRQMREIKAECGHSCPQRGGTDREHRYFKTAGANNRLRLIPTQSRQLRCCGQECPHSTAFTLIEILVAISLFTLIMIAIFSCWKSVVMGAKIGIEAAAAAQRARIGIRTVEDALSTAEISRGNIQYYSFVADTSDDFHSLALTARLPDSFPGANFYGDNIMRRVTFVVEKGKDNQNDLVMTQNPLLVMTSEQSSPYSIVLARDVSFFKLEFWSPKENDWVKEFLATNEFPKMVRVTLGVGHSSQNQGIPYELITRTIYMPSVAH